VRALRGAPPSLFAALVAGLLGVPASAAADVVMPPPSACPEGSTARRCHGPQTCAITGCAEDPCPEGQVCVERALCVRGHCCSGRNCGRPSAVNVDHVTGPCDAEGACAEGTGSCQTRSVCVPQGETPAEPSEGAPEPPLAEEATPEASPAEPEATEPVQPATSAQDEPEEPEAEDGGGCSASGASAGQRGVLFALLGVTALVAWRARR